MKADFGQGLESHTLFSHDKPERERSRSMREGARLRKRPSSAEHNRAHLLLLCGRACRLSSLQIFNKMAPNIAHSLPIIM